MPAQLKAEWEEGKHLIVVSNQGDAREKIRREWRAKLSLIAAKVSEYCKRNGTDMEMPTGVPLRILAGLSKLDVYRKPNIGMYRVAEELYSARGLEIDLEHSVFVGDAAGRLARGGKKQDHGDTDLKFALNLGLKFLTPEVGIRPRTCR